MTFYIKRSSALVPTKGLKFYLHQALSTVEAERTTKNVHASDATQDGGICARFYALADILKPEAKDKSLSASLAMTFQLGRLIEDEVIDLLAKGKRAVTDWKCLSCGHIEQMTKRQEECPVCACRAFHPLNHRYKSPITGISASIDCHTILDDAELLIPTEIKSIDKDEFKKLVAPMAEHRVRSRLYLRTIAEELGGNDHPSGWTVSTDEARILYVSKGGFGVKDLEVQAWGMADNFTPFKEFVITRHDADTTEIVKEPIKVKKFREGGAMPGQRCSSEADPRARDCPVRKPCFSGSYK